MDPTRFDALTKTLVAPGTRRALLRSLTGLPLAAAVAALLGETTDAAKGRRGDRDDRKARRKRKKGKGTGPAPDPNACTTGPFTCPTTFGVLAQCGPGGSCGCVGPANNAPGTCIDFNLSSVEDCSNGAECPTGERCVSTCGSLACVQPCV